MATDPSLHRKRIAFDGATWHALHQLSLDSMRSLQELADEAFRDLLKSVRMQPANEQPKATVHRLGRRS